MKYLFFAILSLALTTTAFSQKDITTFYFHRNGNSCPKEYAAFIGYVTTEKDRIKLKKYTLDGLRLVLVGSYIDTNFLIKDGFHQDYTVSGEKISEGAYVNNTKEGWWTHWSLMQPDKIADSILYSNGTELISIHSDYYQHGQQASRIFKNPGEQILDKCYWYSDGTLTSQMRLIHNTGEKINYYATGEKKSITTYEKGTVKEVKYFSPNGSSISESEALKEEEKANATAAKKRKSSIPTFPGGTDGFRSFFDKHYRFPSHLQDIINTLPSITIVFYLNEKGSPYDASILESSNSDLKESIVNFFRTIPRWEMNGFKKYGPVQYKVRLIRF